MLSNMNIPCVVNDGILHPSNSNPIVIATLDICNDKNGDSPSGRLIWSNKVQAFLLLDPTCSMVISFNLTDMSLNAHKTEQSVRNILNVL